MFEYSGAALVAESVRRQNVPLMYRYDSFDWNSKSFYRESSKRLVRDGRLRVYQVTWSPDPRVKYAKRGLLSRSEWSQQRAFEQGRQRARARYVGTPRVAGSGLWVLGKGLPIMAYGYVGYNILTGGDPNPDNRRTGSFYGFYVDEHGNTRNEFYDLAQYTQENLSGTVEQQTTMIVGAGTAVKNWAQGAAARAIGFAVLQGILG